MFLKTNAARKQLNFDIFYHCVQQITVLFNVCDALSGLLTQSMTAGAPTHCVARSSAVMILTTWDKPVTVFPKEGLNSLCDLNIENK